jgi:hypothetical protein
MARDSQRNSLRRLSVYHYRHAALLGKRRPRIASVVNHGHDVNAFPVVSMVLGAAEREQPVHQASEPLALCLGRLEFAGLVTVGTGGQIFQAQPQRRQRGTQLVGRVSDQSTLSFDQLADPVGHGVELVAERGDLGRSSG